MDVYRKLFAYVPKYTLYGYMAIVISAVSACFQVYGYYYLYQLLKAIIVVHHYYDADVYSIKILIYLTLGAVLYVCSGVVSHKFAFRLETNLRKKGIDGLTDASFRFFDIYSSGYIRKTIDDNAVKTHTAVAHMLPDNAQAFLIPVLSWILGFMVSWRVGAIIILLSVVSALLLKGMMGHGEFMRFYQQSLDKLSSETVEYVRGMQVVKIFGNKLKSFKALYQAIKDYSRYAYDYSISCQKPYVIYQLIFLGIIAIIGIPLSFLLGVLPSPKEIALEMIMIFFLTGIIMVAFMKIMWAGMNIFNANYAINNLEELFRKMQEDKLSYGTRKSIDNFNIEFNHVSFSYGEHNVIKDLSFSLAEKKIYALVGHSGSGKSTIAKLLSGFYTVDSGYITIGGYPLEEYTKETIMNNIAFVFQNPQLFKKSIYENVSLANTHATREEIMRAIHLAECDEIIEKFEQKEHTVIGTDGVYLSGGERQRIAIARAIVKDAQIIIMDEASASIDADNEYKLQKAFKNLMRNKTVIMIAHRLSTIQHVDEILVLEDGNIVERGTNSELIEQQGLYNTLLNLYDRANNWKVSNEKVL